MIGPDPPRLAILRSNAHTEPVDVRRVDFRDQFVRHRVQRPQVGQAPVLTYSGRLRAKATYSARHNTIFQGLAADGAKLALWRLWRAGFRIVNFIHDQVLVEIPTSSACERMKCALEVRKHMIDGMREVVPDVKIEVSYAAMTRWYKDANCVLDSAGTGLCLWIPKGEEEVAASVA